MSLGTSDLAFMAHPCILLFGSFGRQRVQEIKGFRRNRVGKQGLEAPALKHLELPADRGIEDRPA